MHSLQPDYSVVPEILSLTVFLGAFQPLVRKAGPHVNLWFVGWLFVLVHYFGVLLLPTPGVLHSVFGLMSIWALDLCALAFMRAAGNGPITRQGTLLSIEMAAPVLLQSGLATLGIHDMRIQAFVILLLVFPAMHLAAIQSHSKRPYAASLVIVYVVGLILLRFHGATTLEVSSGVLCLLFLVAAYLYSAHAGRITRGVLCAVVGLVGWALSYPLQAILDRFYPSVHLAHALLEVPQYLVVAAVILNLLEEHMAHTEKLAMHDELTGLPNRRLFEERFISAMAESRRNGTPMACLVIDVDDFKTINDTMGHYTGDELLKTLATRLNWHVGPADMLARTGGDEFTALLAGVRDEYHLRFIASAMMSAAGVPLIIDGVSIDFHISIGIAVSPEDADSIEGLRRAADDAMYKAKRAGGSLLSFAGED